MSPSWLWILHPPPCLVRWKDPIVAAQPAPIIVNIGNFHTLAFQFAWGGVACACSSIIRES